MAQVTEVSPPRAEESVSARRWPDWIWLPVVLAGVVVVMLGAQLAASVLDRELAFLTREPQAALQGVWYAGAISNVGALLWAMGVTSSVLAALVQPEGAMPLLAAAGLMILMGADDFFLLHEGIYDKVVEDRWVFAVYLVLLVAYLVAFRGFLARYGAIPIFVLGIGLLVLSGVFDQFWWGYHLVEDGAKLAGIATITFLFAVISYRRLRG